MPMCQQRSPLHGPPAWADAYVGLPWKDRGRGCDGLDCWGLLRLVLGERFGIAIPSYDGVGWEAPETAQSRDEARRALAEFMAANAGDWRPVPAGDEQAGDGVLLRMMGHPIHVGVVVAPGWMLHIEEGTDTCCVPYDDARWARRVVGFYRWVGER